jgi:hypothetical protein
LRGEADTPLGDPKDPRRVDPLGPFRIGGGVRRCKACAKEEGEDVQEGALEERERERSERGSVFSKKEGEGAASRTQFYISMCVGVCVWLEAAIRSTSF